MKKNLFFLLLLNYLYSYEDFDIDGVDDSIDRCLNTPFDEIVDEMGCSKSQKPEKAKDRDSFKDTIFKITLDSATDKDYNTERFLNLYLGYSKNSWDMSISNSHSTQNKSLSSISEDSNLYISIGKRFDFNRSSIKVSLETKVALDKKEGLSPLEKDEHEEKSSIEDSSHDNLKRKYQNSRNSFFISSELSYILSENQSIFLYYMLPLKEHNDLKYTQHPLISIGTDYTFNQDIYGSLSYTYIGSIRKRGKNPAKSIDLLLNYALTDTIFISIGYTHALDRLSYDNTLSFGAGVTF